MIPMYDVILLLCGPKPFQYEYSFSLHSPNFSLPLMMSVVVECVHPVFCPLPTAWQTSLPVLSDMYMAIIHVVVYQASSITMVSFPLQCIYVQYCVVYVLLCR